MKQYQINRARTRNGKIDWEQAALARVNESQWLEGSPIQAFARVCYDEMGLYAQLSANEEHRLARFTGTTDMVCMDSCLELFMCPMSGDVRYFNFEFNPNGALYLGFGQNRYDSVRQLVQDADKTFRVQPYQEQYLWGIEFYIPMTFIRLYFPEFALESGRIIYGNFYKCGEETVQPHYFSWNRIHGDVPDFHKPQCFGKWILQ